MSDSIDLSEIQRRLNNLTLSWKKERTIEIKSKKNRIKIEKEIVDIVELTNPNPKSYNVIDIDNGISLYYSRNREWLDELSSGIADNILDVIDKVKEEKFTLDPYLFINENAVNNNDYCYCDEKEVDDEWFDRSKWDAKAA